jgi:hypothetical protein
MSVIPLLADSFKCRLKFSYFLLSAALQIFMNGETTLCFPLDNMPPDLLERLIAARKDNAFACPQFPPGIKPAR